MFLMLVFYVRVFLCAASCVINDDDDYYAPQLVPAGTAEARISYGNSVCPSVTTRWYTKPR